VSGLGELVSPGQGACSAVELRMGGQMLETRFVSIEGRYLRIGVDWILELRVRLFGLWAKRSLEAPLCGRGVG
jgi:hypothetical protein